MKKRHSFNGMIVEKDHDIIVGKLTVTTSERMIAILEDTAEKLRFLDRYAYN